MDKMKVNFVSKAGVKLASHRMRIMKPAELLNVCVEGIECFVNPSPDVSADINVFNKHFDQENSLKFIKKGEKFGYFSIFDVCDDHFDREDGDFYKEMCKYSDFITCNSDNMKNRIVEVTGKESFMIPDPITFPREEYIERKNTQPNILWYGHRSNAPCLIPWVDAIELPVLAITNTIISHPRIVCKQWKPMLVEKFLPETDIVFLPTQKHPWSKCKSANRAVDAINAGKMVITDSSDVYGHLKDFLFIVDNPDELPSLLELWRTDKEFIKNKIEKGQEFIQKNYSDNIILDNWLNVFETLGLVKVLKDET